MPKANPQGRESAARNRDANSPALPTNGFVRLPGVLQVFPVSRSAWWAGIKAGRYPTGVKLGPRTTAWTTEDIQQLIARIVDTRRGE